MMLKKLDDALDAVGADGGLGLHAALERLRLAIEGGREDVLLAAEALVERPEGDAGLGSDVALADIVEPALFGEGHGHVEDLVSSCLHSSRL